jgi:hypothetical protein
MNANHKHSRCAVLTHEFVHNLTLTVALLSSYASTVGNVYTSKYVYHQHTLEEPKKMRGACAIVIDHKDSKALLAIEELKCNSSTQDKQEQQ